MGDVSAGSVLDISRAKIKGDVPWAKYQMGKRQSVSYQKAVFTVQYI